MAASTIAHGTIQAMLYTPLPSPTFVLFACISSVKLSFAVIPFSVLKMAQVMLEAKSKRRVLSFSNLPASLPQDIRYLILKHWTAPQDIVVVPNLSYRDERLLVTYSCGTDMPSACLPPDLMAEYDRIRHLSWLTAPKYFPRPYDFYMSHYLLAHLPSSATKFELRNPCPISFYQTYPLPVNAEAHPYMGLNHPRLSTHGLEKIVLDFSAPEYFAMFDVCLPGFEQEKEWYHDRHVHSSARFLEKCTHLTLVFGATYRYSHAWYTLDDPEWENARCRPHVCELGLVIDWILEHAWAKGYLHHIETIKLEGEVQPWVKAKWASIFETQRVRGMPRDRFAVHRPDWDRIERRGWEEEMDEGEWIAQENYPPACTCEKGCWEVACS
jgi:hypothetical protein